MYYGTEKQMEKIDVLAVRYGLQIRQMMEIAGWHMVGVFRLLKINKSRKIVIVIGKGNKGGDGLCAARHLINRGWKKISVVLVSRTISPDAEHHLKLLQKMSVDIILFSRAKKRAMQKIALADFIIDSLIGYHLKGAPRGDFKTLIELMNAVPGKIIAYDLPSGLDATSGRCLEPTIRAYATLTLALPKLAFKTKSGREMSSKLFLGDIGIPDFLYDKIKFGSRPKFSETGLIQI